MSLFSCSHRFLSRDVRFAAPTFGAGGRQAAMPDEWLPDAAAQERGEGESPFLPSGDLRAAMCSELCSF